MSMKRIARTNQGGSAVTFAIIGAVLVIALGAGIYYAYQRGDHARTDEPLIGSTSDKKAPASQPSTKSDNSSSNSSHSGTDQTNTGTVTPPTDTTPTTTPSTNGGAPAQIPQTGPSDTFYSAVVLSVLTFIGVLYVRSRTGVRSL